MDFAALQLGVTQRIQDTAALLVDADKDALIRQALQQRYSKDKPWQVVSDSPGNGTSFLALPTVATPGPYAGAIFETEFSFIVQIEYPLNQWPPAILDESHDYRLYQAPAGWQVYLDTVKPAAGEFLRITWTSRHKNDASTAYDCDFDAVCDFAAGLCCDALAARYAQTGDATMAVDSVNYRTKSQEYLTLGKVLKQRYFDFMGIGDASAASSPSRPAIAIGDMDNVMQVGVDRLIHKRGTR